IFPSLTFSSISSLLTGLPPNKHGIIGNFYDRTQKKKMLFQDIRNWDPNAIATETIFEIASKNGLRTIMITGFAVGRICGRGADIILEPTYIKYEDIASFPSEVTLSKVPYWIREQIEDSYSIHINDTDYPLGQKYIANPDIWVMELAKQAIKNNVGDLFLFHFPYLDFLKHYYGKDSTEVYNHLPFLEKIIEELLSYIINKYDSPLIFVVSDHGSTEVTERLTLPIAGNSAIVIKNGGLSYLYSESSTFINEIQHKILSSFGSKIEFVARPHELNPYHVVTKDIGDLTVCFKGGVTDSRTAKAVHGSLSSSDMRIFLSIIGNNLSKGSYENGSILKIAPTIAEFLNISFSNKTKEFKDSLI
ncbi:MAG: alkaline phosphatase family protein, partial [Promethearchaeota archaeon]